MTSSISCEALHVRWTNGAQFEDGAARCALRAARCALRAARCALRAARCALQNDSPRLRHKSLGSEKAFREGGAHFFMLGCRHELRAWCIAAHVEEFRFEHALMLMLLLGGFVLGHHAVLGFGGSAVGHHGLIAIIIGIRHHVITKQYAVT
jgi:hypothetical protein